MVSFQTRVNTTDSYSCPFSSAQGPWAVPPLSLSACFSSRLFLFFDKKLWTRSAGSHLPDLEEVAFPSVLWRPAQLGWVFLDEIGARVVLCPRGVETAALMQVRCHLGSCCLHLSPAASSYWDGLSDSGAPSLPGSQGTGVTEISGGSVLSGQSPGNREDTYAAQHRPD